MPITYGTISELACRHQICNDNFNTNEFLYIQQYFTKYGNSNGTLFS